VRDTREGERVTAEGGVQVGATDAKEILLLDRTHRVSQASCEVRDIFQKLLHSSELEICRCGQLGGGTRSETAEEGRANDSSLAQEIQRDAVRLRQHGILIEDRLAKGRLQRGIDRIGGTELLGAGGHVDAQKGRRLLHKLLRIHHLSILFRRGLDPLLQRDFRLKEIALRRGEHPCLLAEGGVPPVELVHGALDDTILHLQHEDVISIASPAISRWILERNSPGGRGSRIGGGGRDLGAKQLLDLVGGGVADTLGSHLHRARRSIITHELVCADDILDRLRRAIVHQHLRSLTPALPAAGTTGQDDAEHHRAGVAALQLQVVEQLGHGAETSGKSRTVSTRCDEMRTLDRSIRFCRCSARLDHLRTASTPVNLLRLLPAHRVSAA
jgi:hypothetical protein